ncbi:hypothetical protein AB0I54_08870 [Streptomyces sp. NPDC050625]|uniref:hypothetical protein n=1 Tax=Streptomyces sp. NPDC050625 TaxID=3154629 RepID=UPI003427A8C7
MLVRNVVPLVDTSDGSVPAHRVLAALAKQVVEASFTATCPGHDVYGSVTTWFGSYGDSVACGVDPGDDAWVQEAYRLTCGRLSR